MSKHHRSPARKDKQAQFVSEPPPRRGTTPVALVLGAAFLFLGAFVLVVGGGRGGGPVAATPAGEAGPAGADVVLPASTFDDGQARFYRYTTAAGREVRFFVMKSADGVIRAAFDSCDVCYRERRGYRQAGDAMVCNNCGKAFPSTQINVLQGGCNPAPLERSVVGGQVVLSAAALSQGAAYF
jgi:uncharacterized membrane protein